MRIATFNVNLRPEKLKHHFRAFKDWIGSSDFCKYDLLVLPEAYGHGRHVRGYYRILSSSTTLYSRYPIKKSFILSYATPDEKLTCVENRTCKSAVFAVLQLPNEVEILTIGVYVRAIRGSDTVEDFTVQWQQYQQIWETLTTQFVDYQGKLVMLGDFNLNSFRGSSDYSVYQQLMRKFNVQCQYNDQQSTTKFHTRAILDHILTSPQLRVIEAWIRHSPEWSDHLLLEAELAVESLT